MSRFHHPRTTCHSEPFDFAQDRLREESRHLTSRRRSPKWLFLSKSNFIDGSLMRFFTSLRSVQNDKGLVTCAKDWRLTINVDSLNHNMV